MDKYLLIGTQIRENTKELILEYMQNHTVCSSNGEGIKQAELFRACGLDWGDCKNATSTNQQYWLVALLRMLESDNLIIRDTFTKKWKLKK